MDRLYHKDNLIGGLLSSICCYYYFFSRNLVLPTEVRTAGEILVRRVNFEERLENERGNICAVKFFYFKSQTYCKWWLLNDNYKFQVHKGGYLLGLIVACFRRAMCLVTLITSWLGVLMGCPLCAAIDFYCRWLFWMDGHLSTWLNFFFL